MSSKKPQNKPAQPKPIAQNKVDEVLSSVDSTASVDAEITQASAPIAKKQPKSRYEDHAKFQKFKKERSK